MLLPMSLGSCEDKYTLLMWNIEELWAGEYTPLLPVCLAQYPFSVCWHRLLPFSAMPVSVPGWTQPCR